MKKIIILLLFFIMLNSISSIANYSAVLEYNFLTVNILMVENSSNTFNSGHTSVSGDNSSTTDSHILNSTNKDIDSDVFIDTNTNIQIKITK